jgi:hypothetical protein
MNLLKWNNPIRSYAALQTLRFFKQHQKLLNGKIFALDILMNDGIIFEAKQKIK